MHQATKVLAIVLCATSPVAMGADSDTKRIRAEIITKADSLFGAHYTQRAGKPLRTFDKHGESGPVDDAVIYWFNNTYVVRLVFATDGSLARLELFPEALRYSILWTSETEDTVTLGPPGEMRWLMAVAGQLRATGDPVSVYQPPDGCFQSSQNLYCIDRYELAKVSFDCREDYRVQPSQISLKEITIAYKQSVIGIVAELKAVSWPQAKQVRVGPLWYQIFKEPDSRLEKPFATTKSFAEHRTKYESWFDKLAVGSKVSLMTFGCAGNETVCDAISAPAAPPKH